MITKIVSGLGEVMKTSVVKKGGFFDRITKAEMLANLHVIQRTGVVCPE
jgi:hypothetical protein